MVARLYLHGMTMGTAGPGLPPGTEVLRGEVRGWSQGAVRRHTRWLYSVDGDNLEHLGVGFAVTLTLRDTPSTAKEWHALRRAWVRAMEREGMVALHWVVEWQKRGTPHLHTAVYFDPVALGGRDGGRIARELWVDRAARFGAQLGAQYALPIDNLTGWTKYLSKHAARGVRHYQRQGIPEGWEKSGRLWGHTGDWPVVEPEVVQVLGAAPLPLHVPNVGRPTPADRRRLVGTPVAAPQAQHALRRLVRSYVLAEHREALRTAQTPQAAAAARRGIRYARRMLRCTDPKFSTVRGLSLWIPYEVASRLVDHAMQLGRPQTPRGMIAP